MREHRAHLGIAHDGDADRVLLCDETGTLIDGDDIMAIAARELLAAGTLAAQDGGGDGDEQRRAWTRSIDGAGGKVMRTAVGDKNVIDEMLRQRLTTWAASRAGT